ncbi:MAG: sulfite exporter TauE/SafE family protein, partial [Pseudomonadota bacterium]
ERRRKCCPQQEGAKPFGVLTLELVDADILRGGILLGILAVSVMLIYGITLPVPPGAGPTFAAGTVSGFGNGAAGLSGLPVALFLSARRDEIASLRATVSIYIVLIGMLTLAFLTLRGLVRADTLWATGAALPPMLAGLLLGRRSFNRISPATFRNAVLLLLCLASVLGLLPLL